MAQYAIFYDQSRCNGCKTCQMACKDYHDLPAGRSYNYVIEYEATDGWKTDSDGLFIPQGLYSYFVALSCNHCDDPACVKACPTGACAKDEATAKVIAKSVICSSLVKAAMFGADANCGRILCAIGYSGAEVDVKKIDVSYRSAKGEILVCKDGMGLAFDEDKAKEILLESEIDIIIKLGDGTGEAEAYGCDLTYDYVKINGDYRT